MLGRGPAQWPSTLQMPKGVRPEGIVITGSTAYATSFVDGTIYRFDLRTGERRVLVPATGVGSIGILLDDRGPRPHRRSRGLEGDLPGRGRAAVVLAVLLRRAIPWLAPHADLPYPRLLLSVWGGGPAGTDRVRWTVVLGATAFAVFTIFWTALAFQLSGPPFSYPVSVIGLFGLAGLASAFAAQRAGHLHDRGWSLPATGWDWAAIAVSFVVAVLGGHSVVPILIAIVLLDIAAQGVNILNQMRRFAVSRRPAAGSTRRSSPTTSSAAPSARPPPPCCGPPAAGPPSPSPALASTASPSPYGPPAPLPRA